MQTINLSKSLYSMTPCFQTSSGTVAGIGLPRLPQAVSTRIELHAAGFEQSGIDPESLGQVEQAAEEGSLAVVGHADLERGWDCLAVLDLIFEPNFAARDLVAVDQDGQFHVPGWIVLAGLLRRAVCVHRAICSSRWTASLAPASFRPSIWATSGRSSLGLVMTNWPSRAIRRNSGFSPAPATRMKSEGFPSGDAMSTAFLASSHAAASPSRLTASGGRRKAGNQGLVGLARVELGIAVDRDAAGRREDFFHAGGRQRLGRVAKFVGRGIESEESESDRLSTASGRNAVGPAAIDRPAAVAEACRERGWCRLDRAVEEDGVKVVVTGGFELGRLVHDRIANER